MDAGFLVFVGVCLAVSASPGPAVLYIVARTLDQGLPAGLASMAGITLGGIVHLLLAAFGVAAIAAAWPLSLLLLQIAGALYLIYLGAQRTSSVRGAADGVDVHPEPLAAIFRQGVVVNLTNPKTMLFLLAFLPQFVTGNATPVWRQMLLLGFTFIAVAALTDGAYALIANRIRGSLRQGNAPAWSGFLAGGVYALLGLLGLFDALRQLLRG